MMQIDNYTDVMFTVKFNTFLQFLLKGSDFFTGTIQKDIL